MFILNFLSGLIFKENLKVEKGFNTALNFYIMTPKKSRSSLPTQILNV